MDTRVLLGGGSQMLMGGCRRPMGPEEGAHMAHRQRDLVRGRLPRIEAHLGVRREMHALHRHGVGVRRDVVRQHQYRRLTSAYEIARHGEYEVSVRAVHLADEGVDHLHRDVGPTGAQRRAPALDVILVEEVGNLRAEAARLRQHGGDDAPGRAPQQVPDERGADAEAHHHELPDAEVVDHAELVVGVGVPWSVDLERTGGLAAIGVAEVRRDNAVLALELLHRVKGVVRKARNRRVESAAGDHQQRKAGADLLVLDADDAFFVKRHRNFSLQYVVSDPRLIYWAAARIGTCALRKLRTRLIVRSFRSAGSLHGNTVISALGAREATSIEVCSGCAGVSSGTTRIGVRQLAMKARETLYKKSGFTR